jgi:hypothetical protein
MKILPALLLFLSWCHSIESSEFYREKLFDPIIRHAQKRNGEVLIMNYDCKWSDVDKILLKESGIVYNFQKLNRTKEFIFLRESAIIAFSSVSAYREFKMKAFLRTELPKNLQFYTYISGTESYLHLQDVLFSLIKKRTTDLTYHINFFSEYEYIITDDKKTVLLLGSTHLQGCLNVRIDPINIFHKNNLSWEQNYFELKKEWNLNGCKMHVSVDRKWPASDYLNNGSTFVGFNVDIIRAVTKSLNISLKLLPDYAKYSRLQLWSGPLESNSNYHVTSPYFYNYFYIFIPPGAEYDGYEKLLLPFDLYVWILLILTCSLSLGTICVVNRASEAVRDFVFGRNVHDPTLNLARIFFGLGQNILPGRNFARFITMMFIIFSLIIRTAWQGKMFEFMQRDMTKPEVKSIEEMIEKNFTFYLSIWFLNSFKPEEMFQK